MFSAFGPGIIGVVCIILGVHNMQGHIGSIHWYHRHRISPEDIVPFGKLAGLGTIIVGASTLIFSLFLIMQQLTEIEAFTIVGSVIMVIGLAVGLGITMYAIIKYNKGLF